MASCAYCKKEGQKTENCAYCGKQVGNVGQLFIYGRTEKEAASCEGVLTDKYIIVRNIALGETLGGAAAGATFGVLGVLAAAVVDGSVKKCYGYYDLKEIRKAIYPYHTKVLKKDIAIKFVNLDGTDFILNFQNVKWAKGFAELLPTVGVTVENGGTVVHPVCCERPFVDGKTFSNRVCHSAASFVQLIKEQFAAPAIVASAQPQPAYQPPVQPVQPPVQQPVQPAYQPPVQKPVQPAYQPPVQQKPVQPAYQPPVRQPVQPVQPPVQQKPVQPAYQPPVQQPVQPAYQPPVRQPVQPVQPPVQQKPVQPVQPPVQQPVRQVPQQPAPQTPVQSLQAMQLEGNMLNEQPDKTVKSVSPICPVCGNENRATARFCDQCGKQLFA